MSLPPRPPDWRTRLARRLGHRGAFLLFLAVLDYSYGYSLWATPAPQRMWDLFLPWEAWGVIWIVVGVACTAGAFSAADRLAFGLAASLKAAWAGVMADAWLIQGIPRGWVSATIFGCFSVTVLIVSSWPEPVRL